MRMIVNCSPLRPPLTGIGHYTREILLRLVDDPEIEELEGYYFHRWLTRSQIRSLLDAAPVSASPSFSALFRRVAALPGGRGLYRRALGMIHRRRFSQRRGWLYWETNYVPLAFRGKTLLGIYDLSHVRFARFHPRSRVDYFEANLQKALEGAAAVVTISEFSAREIAEHYGTDRSKIAIVPPGVSPVFHPRPSGELALFRERYALPSCYLLSVATLEPRKNFQNLCRAYLSLDAELRSRHPLVVVGAKGWHLPEIEELLEPLERQGQVIRLGYVPEGDLPLLYAGSCGLCYPSLYEGYGMPIAEAVASGIPVVTSGSSAMPEAGGNRAWYADPLSIPSIARSIEAMLASPTPLYPPGSSHLLPPRHHSWEEAASKMIELFRFCYNGDNN